MKSLLTFLLTAVSFFMVSQTYKGQDYSSCGLRSVNMNIRAKIFGGFRSRPGMWPWQVAIYRKRDGGRSRFFCGGALINSRWIVTAAHCFHKSFLEQHINYRYTVIAGEYNILSQDPHEQMRKALAIYKHPNFVARTYENDIAIVELDKGVKMGPSVRAICLPKAHKNVSRPGEVVSVAGWGFTSKGVQSPVLLYSSYQIQSNRKCRHTTRHHFNDSLMFCAGDGKGGNDTCQGDSGGSMVRQVVRNGRRRWVAVGLVSWGEGCGTEGKYGYYTRMEPFVGWIQSKINGSNLSCGNPGNITNGFFIGSEVLVGFTIKWKCNQGYQLIGRSKRKCKRSGKWARAPKCRKIQCRDPGEPRYGVRRPRKHQYYYKDKVGFSCKTNYTIIGKSTIICQSDGMWNGFQPACLAPCKDPGVPEGGVRLDHSFKHGQTVRFMCRNKNQPPSVSFTTCSNGRWSRNIPRCNPGCGDPGTPINGQKEGSDFTSKKKVYFMCNRGYRRVGPRYLQCQSNQRWSGKMPTCQPLICIKPKPPANAYIYSPWKSKENYRFNELVAFKCKEGYFSSELIFQRCLANGWSKTNLRCSAIECKDLGKLINGSRIPDKNKYVFEDKIHFKCNTNHTLMGNAFIICQKTKYWTGTLPRCLSPCRDPGIPIGGHRYGHSFRHNEVVRFSCNRNWNMEGTHTIRCYDGRWDHKTPKCLEGCSRPEHQNSGNMQWSSRKNLYRNGEEVAFGCYNGYKLDGDQKITCRNGKWSNVPPSCKRLCYNPGRPANGAFRGIEFFEGKQVIYSCHSTYDLFGSQTLQCLSSGRWNASRPQCKTRCSDPGTPTNGIRIGNRFNHNMNITFSCNEGYTMSGRQSIKCSDGQWSGEIPTCSDCGLALGMENKKIPDQNIRASTSMNAYHEGKEGRLNGQWAWCSGRELQPYLVIDFGKPYRIKALATQGSTYYKKWVEAYVLESSLAGSAFHTYREDYTEKMFKGNRDSNNIIRQNLNNRLIARRIKITPMKPGGYTTSPACMRVEIYGCDLPLDCVVIGSRVVAQWQSHPLAGSVYLKAYLINKRNRRVEFENEVHRERVQYRNFPTYINLPFVLDVPPRQGDLQVGTRVLAPWSFRYYIGTIVAPRDRYNRYRVRADDSDVGYFTIDQIRLLKTPSFCK